MDEQHVLHPPTAVVVNCRVLSPDQFSVPHIIDTRFPGQMRMRITQHVLQCPLHHCPSFEVRARGNVSVSQPPPRLSAIRTTTINGTLIYPPFLFVCFLNFRNSSDQESKAPLGVLAGVEESHCPAVKALCNCSQECFSLISAILQAHVLRK